MTSRMVGSVLTLVILLFSAAGAAAQTYTQIQWGMNKGVTPYAFGANINGVWSNLGTVSASGVWSIPITNITGLLNGNNTWTGAQTFSGGATIPFTQSGAGAVTTTVDAKLKQIVSPLDYGSTCSSASLQAAVNYLSTVYGGGEIQLPLTGCALTTTVTINASGISIVGQGRQSTQIYLANNHTYNVFSVGPDGDGFRANGFTIIGQLPTVYGGTANYGSGVFGIAMDPGADSPIIDDVGCLYLTNCLKITGSKASIRHVSAVNLKPAAGVAFYVNMWNAATSHMNEVARIQDAFTDNGFAAIFQPYAALDIVSAADIECDNCSFQHSGTGIVVEPTGTGVGDGSRFATDVVIRNGGGDNGSGDGMRIRPTGYGVAQRILATDSWFSSNSGRGIFIANSSANAAVQGVSIANPRVFSNGVDGIYLSGYSVAGVESADGVTIINPHIAGNAGTGIVVEAGFSYWSVVGGIIGPVDGFPVNDYGLIVGVGASDYYKIIGTMIYGNTSGQLVDNGTGIHKSIVGSP